MNSFLYYTGYMIAGYLMGSLLFALFWGRLVAKKNILAESRDNNPGTANAYMQGGFWCGTLTLLCDMAKGFLPVFFCLRWEDGINASEVGMAFVLFAPVLGHTYPLFRHFQGGKGIAVTFGSLLGFFPSVAAALTLAFFFILFSLVIRVTPHFYRTIGTYLFTLALFWVWADRLAIKLGFLLITIAVCVRMHASQEEREKCKVGLLWMH